jgi:hypothetical protein
VPRLICVIESVHILRQHTHQALACRAFIVVVVVVVVVVGWLVGWLVDWLVGWLIGWLADWLVLVVPVVM